MNPPGDTRTELRQIRQAREISASELARAAGVSRQTIYAIEDGSYIPNTAVALRLARALDTRVEDLFRLESGATDVNSVDATLLAAPEVEEGPLVRLCRVGDRTIAVPAPAMPAYLPVADGILEAGQARRSKRRVAVGARDEELNEGKRLLLAGCDPALSLLSEALLRFGIEVVNVSCSSRQALEWLKRGWVHAAGTHLLDRSTCEYNLPVIQRIFPERNVRVVTFAGWEQGLIIRKGNPKGIKTVADLGRKDIRIVNREKGSGSRDLLDNALLKAGVAPETISGYDAIAAGHLMAAQAVALGTADCCIAAGSAALPLALDFVPLTAERFDLCIPGNTVATHAGNVLLDVLNRGWLRSKLHRIAGYRTEQTGAVQM